MISCCISSISSSASSKSIIFIATTWREKERKINYYLIKENNSKLQTCCERLSMPLKTSPKEPFPILSCLVKISSGSTFCKQKKKRKMMIRNLIIIIKKMNVHYIFIEPQITKHIVADYLVNISFLFIHMCTYICKYVYTYIHR